MQGFRKLSRSVVISLEETLTGGQSFRWKKTDQEGEFRGVAFNILWCLKVQRDTLHYQVLAELPYGSEDTDTSDDALLQTRMKVGRPKERSGRGQKLLYPEDYYDSLLCKYFRLDVDLDEQCQKWAKAHKHFRQVSKERHTAIRVLDQDPVENLFSFICSQNNHINRITSLVEKLATLYGSPIIDVDGVSYCSFPSFAKMAQPEVEETLRKNGFGYRAKFINKSAQEIGEKGGLQWFAELNKKSYKETHEELKTLTGIGPKVADCICLMSLGHLSAIPVDTHIFKIAQMHYCKDLKTVKSVTSPVYNRIGDSFRDVYGPLAGWAQTVLFCADLRQFEASPAEKKPVQSRKRKGE